MSDVELSIAVYRSVRGYFHVIC